MIVLKDENAKQLKAKERIKTLGVHVNPSINWDKECEHIKTKLIKSIKT